MNYLSNVIIPEINHKKSLSFYKDSSFFSSNNIDKNICSLKSLLNKKEKILKLSTPVEKKKAKYINNFRNDKHVFDRRMKNVATDTNNYEETVKKDFKNFKNNSILSSINKKKPNITNISIINLNNEVILNNEKISLDDLAKTNIKIKNNIYNSKEYKSSYSKIPLKKLSSRKLIFKNNEEEKDSNVRNECKKDSSLSLTYRESFIGRKNTSKGSQNNSSVIYNSPPTSQVNFIYNKVFDKKFEYLIRPKKISQNSKNELDKKQFDESEINRFNKNKEYINDKIKTIKSKIFFMKGIFDYSYPQIIVQKFKTLNEILSKEKLKKDKKRESILSVQISKYKNSENNSINLNYTQSGSNNLNNSLIISKYNAEDIPVERNNTFRVLRNISSGLSTPQPANKTRGKTPNSLRMSSGLHKSQMSAFSKGSNSTKFIKVLSPILINNNL